MITTQAGMLWVASEYVDVHLCMETTQRQIRNKSLIAIH
jgi:hypothetical protein